MNRDYWTEFWKNHGRQSTDAHPLAQVLRTVHGEPISPEDWQRTVADLLKILELRPEDKVLDLCGGNGLIATEIAKHCREVVLVDISEDLLGAISRAGVANITPVAADMRTVEFDDCSFSRVLCYAGLQYLSLGETAGLFGNVHRWLTSGGLFIAGDIPDSEHLWDFYNTPERLAAYFQKLALSEPVIGTWFQKQWLTALAQHSGFRSAAILEQPEYQTCSRFRFDFRGAK